MVDERQVAQVINMLANNYNGSKGQGDDADLSPALTNSLFSSGEGQVCACSSLPPLCGRSLVGAVFFKRRYTSYRAL